MASYYMIQYAVLSKEIVVYLEKSAHIFYYRGDKKVFVEYRNGMLIEYTTSDNEPRNEEDLVLEEEVARFLADFGEPLLVAGIALCFLPRLFTRL